MARLSKFSGISAIVFGGTLLNVLQPVVAQTWTWTGNINSNWSQDGNWTPSGFPNGIDHVAQFLDSPAGPSSVTVDQPVSVGRIVIDDDDGCLITGSLSAPVTLDVSTGAAQVDVNNNFGDGEHFVDVPLVLNDDLEIDAGEGKSFSHDADVPANALTFNSEISGNGGINKLGSAVAALQAACNYIGTTRVNNGRLKINVFADRLPITTHLIVNDPGIFDVSGYAQRVGALSGDGEVTNSDNVNVGQYFTVDGNTNTTFSGVMTGARFKFRKSGAGFLTLSGTSTYGRDTLIDGPGGIKAGTSNCFPTEQQVFVDGVFDLNGFDQTVKLGGGFFGGTIRNIDVLADYCTLSVLSGQYGGINGGVIHGKIHVRKVGGGTFEIAGTHTYLGLTIVNGGILRLMSGDVIPYDPKDGMEGNLFVDAGAKLDLNGYEQTLGNPTGAATGMIDNAHATESSNLIVDVPFGLTRTYEGLITGKIRLDKWGDGTLVLTGANTYNDAPPSTGLNRGTLTINTPAPNSGTGPGTVEVVNGLLNGTGRVGGDVELCACPPGAARLGGNLKIGGKLTNKGGKIEPGDSPGVIEIAGDFEQQAQGEFNVEIGGPIEAIDYDTLSINGDAMLGGTLNIAVINGYQPDDGFVYEIIAAAQVIGQFATVNGKAIGGGKSFEVQYDDTAVRLFVIPAGGNGIPAAGEWGLVVMSLAMTVAATVVFRTRIVKRQVASTLDRHD